MNQALSPSAVDGKAGEIEVRHVSAPEGLPAGSSGRTVFVFG
jgi:hypothetical protein